LPRTAVAIITFLFVSVILEMALTMIYVNQLAPSFLIS
jgi:hypothetical protein